MRVVSTWVSEADSALLRILAEEERISVCALVRRIVMPAVRERVVKLSAAERTEIVADARTDAPVAPR
jgi:hypothetical protein